MGQLEGPSPTYNVPLILRLEGRIDRQALQDALNDVIARHEILRTLFVARDGVPFQQIVPVDQARMEVIWAEVDSADVTGRVAEACRYAFDLGVELPIRAEVFSSGPEEQVLVLLMHHIACDGWSMGPLSRDLATAYGARLSGQLPQWEALPVQYVDYTLWQQDLLGSEDDPDSLIARQAAYWRQALAELPEELELPFDRPRPATASHLGGSVNFSIDAAITTRIVELARENGTTPFMVLQAALAVLLSGMGAGTDIPIGTPVAGRSDEALDSLIGFFVNTLVLRADLSGRPTFRELLARVRDTDLAAFEHQDLPFERLVELLNPTRSLARHPLFQILLVLQNNTQADFRLPTLITQEYNDTDTAAAKFDLAFYLQQDNDVFIGSISYATDLFDSGTVETLAARFAFLLDSVTTQPDARIDQIDMLTEQERHQILVEWNGSSKEIPSTTLPELFQTQVLLTPDATALTFGDTELTYAELDTHANQLAHHLIGQGAGPEKLVALALPRSEQMVIALLAVLKAGSAYLPIDPDYPAERIRYMLQDARPLLLLTTESASKDLPQEIETPRVILDQTATTTRITNERKTSPTNTDRHTPLRPEHPAYVIYTSGSTGRPKGV
ncbi:condensation domain-containing protein, partial [Nonomuraea sp. NPDC050556]|uniref:condensation domain-containing protein n=1 Tax=Nonomuraea sp. NPDC050556 TaxID=3364369 RepID=UPI00379312F2